LGFEFLYHGSSMCVSTKFHHIDVYKVRNWRIVSIKKIGNSKSFKIEVKRKWHLPLYHWLTKQEICFFGFYERDRSIGFWFYT
jgi:hypothetical protein